MSTLQPSLRSYGMPCFRLHGTSSQDGIMYNNIINERIFPAITSSNIAAYLFAQLTICLFGVFFNHDPSYSPPQDPP